MEIPGRKVKQLRPLHLLVRRARRIRSCDRPHAFTYRQASRQSERFVDAPTVSSKFRCIRRESHYCQPKSFFESEWHPVQESRLVTIIDPFLVGLLLVAVALYRSRAVTTRANLFRKHSQRGQE